MMNRVRTKLKFMSNKIYEWPKKLLVLRTANISNLMSSQYKKSRKCYQ